MVDLDTIMTLAFMKHIVDLHAYDLHLGDEEVNNNFIKEY